MRIAKSHTVKKDRTAVWKPSVRVDKGRRTALASSSLHSLALVLGRGLKRCLVQSIMRAREKTSEDKARREAAVVRTAVVAFMSECTFKQLGGEDDGSGGNIPFMSNMITDPVL